MADDPVPTGDDSAGQSSTAIFLVLRRMRAPLLVLISTFAISVFGLTLIPGRTAEGAPWRMDVFDAFYFMSYTASTIGYGEIPQPFSTGQRMWVTISIYLSVIAWAYAIGSVLALLQDRGFRTALNGQRFTRSVHLLREPFLLLVGYGQAGETLARALDERDRRLVVIDNDPARIDALDLASFHSDVPGAVGDARNPDELVRAGLDNPRCVGVVALTDDDEANLAVVMAAGLMRPELPVVARTMEIGIADRMREFGSPLVVDPFNLFGDELMLAVTSPDTSRLLNWLMSGPGDPLPPIPELPRNGRWIVCGLGRFGGRLVDDLHAHGIQTTVVDPHCDEAADGTVIRGDATDPEVMRRADPGTAVGFAAATDNDTTNLSLIVAARRANPDLFLVARQNLPVNAPLFAELPIDSLLVPTRLIAHEALARIGDPLLWRFDQGARTRPDEWSRDLIGRLETACGSGRPDLWEPTLRGDDNPALNQWLASGTANLGDLMRDPEDRDRSIDCVPLLLRGADRTVLAPDGDTRLAADDQLLLAGTASARRALDATLSVPSVTEYTVNGRRVGNGWVWRTLVNRD
ncbi:MAG: NAD-binding protein [Candidatus Nanopelagicales bacterium]